MDNIPIPDPTVLTVEMLKHEDSVLRDSMTAALQSQKEAAAAQNAANAAAVTKSESATAKQIDGISNLLAANTKTMDEKNIAVVNLLGANTKTLDDKIKDLTGRMNRNDGRTTGLGATIGMVVGIAGVGIGAIAVVLTLIARMH